eukprot:364500-Chlamydomonas_euryale.AAC.33
MYTYVLKGAWSKQAGFMPRVPISTLGSTHVASRVTPDCEDSRDDSAGRMRAHCCCKRPDTVRAAPASGACQTCKGGGAGWVQATGARAMCMGGGAGWVEATGARAMCMGGGAGWVQATGARAMCLGGGAGWVQATGARAMCMTIPAGTNTFWLSRGSWLCHVSYGGAVLLRDDWHCLPLSHSA